MVIRRTLVLCSNALLAVSVAVVSAMTSARALAVEVTLEPRLPAEIAYDLKPISVEVAVSGAEGATYEADVSVFDMYRRRAGGGPVTVAIADGKGTAEISFTPPAFGWYAIQCQPRGAAPSVELPGVARFIGVTPKFAGMHVLQPGESTNDWNDLARHAFCGMGLDRTNTHFGGAERLQRTIDAAKTYGVKLLVQFEGADKCAPELVREVVTRHKGVVKYWEIVNEPNLGMTPEAYVKLLEQVSPLIKSIDPEAQVVGPDTCGIDLAWNASFCRLGGNKLVDVLSTHDYEGHESIDPDHWRYKYGELRAIMATHGDATKPIWQTERAIGATRGGISIGPVQAVRIMLWCDLLETQGVPIDNSSYYYLNDTGHMGCPSYVWAQCGPFPGALALRTRRAMTMGSRYAGQLDFGRSGNAIFMGLRFVADSPGGEVPADPATATMGSSGAAASTIILRNYGTLDLPLELDVTGTTGTTGNGRLHVVDAFGNVSIIPVTGGKATVIVSQMPIYLRLAKGQDVSVAPMDFGRDLAGSATITYSGKAHKDMGLLTNGIIESHHAGHPYGGTDGAHIWSADMPGAGEAPATLDIVFPEPRTIDRVKLSTERADNGFSTLLDYDLQYLDGGSWKTIEERRTALPASDAMATRTSGATVAMSWALDTSFHLHRFAPVTTTALRIVPRRTTFGFAPDQLSADAVAKTWKGSKMTPVLMLKEIEAWGPPPAASIACSVAESFKTAAFAREPITVTARNRSGAAVDAIVKAIAPAPWTIAPAESHVSLAAGDSKTVTLGLVAPTGLEVGDVRVQVQLVDAKGRIIDAEPVLLSVRAPVRMDQRPPPALDPVKQPLEIGLSNLTAAPLTGTVHVDIATAGAASRALDVPFGPLEAGASSTVRLDVAGLRLQEGATTATWTVTANGLTTRMTQPLTVRAWNVVGPFAKDFAKDFGPEKSVDVAASYTDQMGNVAVWRQALAASSGYVDLQAAFQPNTSNVCAYAAAYVKSPSARNALVSLGTDDGGKVWVNGVQAWAQDIARGAAPDQDRAPIELKAGWNTVLVKITQGGGGWGFYLDVLGNDGKPLTDVVWALKPE